jgi:predicted metal-dependent hydrolase
MSQPFSYTLRTSTRARVIRITVAPGGVVQVVKPVRASLAVVNHFVQKKQAWIARAVARMRTIKPQPSPALLRREYHELKEEARAFVARRLPELNRPYGFSYRAVHIRNQKTRWGSCSRSGTLSFHYRILKLPPALQDYLLTHELCHLAQMNHGKRFWELIARTLPEYQSLRVALRQYNRSGE